MKKLIDDFINYLKNDKNYSKHTILSYENDLMQFLNYLLILNKIVKIKEINHILLRKYIVYLKRE